MKNLKQILILAFLLTIGNNLIAQCVNDVNTNPSSPTNNKLPDNNQDQRFLNGFRWWLDPTNSNIPLNDMGFNVANPSQDYGLMEPFNSYLYLNYYYYLNEQFNDVMLPENGWEILIDNRGWYPDNSTPVDWTQNVALRKIPSVIFYNKYSGRCRFFVRYGNNETPDQTIDAVQLSFSYQNTSNMSGLFRLGAGYDRSLDKLSTTSVITTKVPNPGGAELWFSGDFQMAYDPCVCDFESEVSVFFSFINIADIVLEGRSVGITDNVVDFSGAIDKTFLSDITNDGSSGNIIYEKMESLIDDYSKRLISYQQELASVQKFNKELDKRVKLMKLAKVVVTVGFAAAGVSQPALVAAVVSSFSSIASWDDAGKKNFTKELDKAFTAGFDFLITESMEKQTNPEKPYMPVTTITEMRFVGSSENRSPISGPSFNTPGSKNSEDINLAKPTQYPVYNEILGQFALLESPKLLVFNDIKTVECFPYNTQKIRVLPNANSSSATFFDLPLMQFSREYTNQIKFKENLKYTFNPAVPIESHNIEVGLEVRRRVEYSGSYPPPLYGVTLNPNVKHFHQPQLTANFNSIDVNVDDQESFNLEDQTTFTPLMLPIDAVNNICYALSHKSTFLNPGISHNISQGYSTLWAGQVDYFNDETYGNCEKMLESFNYDAVYDYYLKIQLSITYPGFNTEGDPIAFNYLFTYKVDPEDIMNVSNSLQLWVDGTHLDIGQFPEDLAINGVNFDGSQIDGCTLNNNIYNCQAWNNVIVKGNNVVASGYQVLVKAGNQIEMLPEASIVPEMELSIVPVLNYSDPMPVMDQNEVTAFCSSKYKAREGARLLKDSMIFTVNDLNFYESDETANNLHFVLFPNPANDEIFIRFDRETNILNLTVTDLSGRSIPFSQNSSNNVINLQFKNIMAGTYIVTIKTDEDTFIEKLIIN